MCLDNWVNFLFLLVGYSISSVYYSEPSKTAARPGPSFTPDSLIVKILLSYDTFAP